MAYGSVYRGFGSTANQFVLSKANRNYTTRYFKTTHSSGDIRAYYDRMYFTGGGGGEVYRPVLTQNAATVTGATVNAIHATLGFGTSGNLLGGLGHAARFSLDTPDAAVTGNSGVIGLDINAGGTSTSVGQRMAFMRATLGGNATGAAALEDGVSLISLNGFTAATGNVYTGNSVRCDVDGTQKYIMLGDYEGSIKWGGSYSSPLSMGTVGYQLKTYGADATDDGFSVCTFHFIRGTGSTALFGSTALVESSSTGSAYPKTLEGGQFMAGLTAGAKLATRGGDGTAGMYGAWVKVYSDATAIVDSGAYSAALWVDNQHSSNSYSGTEYGIFATTGGTRPDAFIGFDTSSSGYDALLKWEDSDDTCLTDSSLSLSSQAGAITVVTPSGTRYIPLYSS